MIIYQNPYKRLTRNPNKNNALTLIFNLS